jgi:hypothetical protein
VGRRGHTPPNRSNWAKEKRTFSVSRPMLVVVLLGDRHEQDAAAVKDLDELGKIEEHARSLLQSRHQQL